MGGQSERPSRSVALASLRFGLTNALMLVFIVALIAGGGFIALALALAVLIGTVGDEICGDDNDRQAVTPHWLYDANLYATLPLMIVMTGLYAHYLTAADPVGMIAMLSSWGISFAAAPAFSKAGPLLAATLGVGVFYGFAAITVGHELFHRSNDAVARAVSHMLLAFTFETSSPLYHMQMHHRDAGTFRDPSTARRRETVYAFAWRLILGSLRGAFSAEARRLRRQGDSVWSWRNRSLRGELCSIAVVAAVGSIAGIRGIAGFVAAAAVGKMLLVTISYAQHYGLVRVEGTPFAAHHAWDCHRFVSNALLYNLPQHSDHHQHGGKTYCQLAASDAPRLPYGYQTMSLIALAPRLWCRVMDPLLADWDRRFASEAERSLVHERGWEIVPTGQD